MTRSPQVVSSLHVLQLIFVSISHVPMLSTSSTILILIIFISILMCGKVKLSLGILIMHNTMKIYGRLEI